GRRGGPPRVRRCLPGAVRAGQTEGRAGLDREGDSAQGFDLVRSAPKDSRARAIAPLQSDDVDRHSRIVGLRTVGAASPRPRRRSALVRLEIAARERHDAGVVAVVDAQPERVRRPGLAFVDEIEPEHVIARSVDRRGPEDLDARAVLDVRVDGQIDDAPGARTRMVLILEIATQRRQALEAEAEGREAAWPLDLATAVELSGS